MTYVITDERPTTPDQFTTYLDRRVRPSVADLWRFVLAALADAKKPNPDWYLANDTPPLLVAELNLDPTADGRDGQVIAHVDADGSVFLHLYELCGWVSDDGKFSKMATREDEWSNSYDFAVNAFGRHVLVADEVEYWHSPDEGGVFDIQPVRLKLDYAALMALVNRLGTVDADTIAHAAGLLHGVQDFQPVHITAAQTLTHLSERPFVDADMLWRAVLYLVARDNPAYPGDHSQARHWQWSGRETPDVGALYNARVISVGSERATLHLDGIFRMLRLSAGDQAGESPRHAELEAFVRSPLVCGALKWAPVKKSPYDRRRENPTEWDVVYPESVELAVPWSVLVKAIGYVDGPTPQVIDPDEVWARSQSHDLDEYNRYIDELVEAEVSGPGGWRAAFEAGLSPDFVRLLGRERFLYPADSRGVDWRTHDLPNTCAALREAMEHGIPAEYLATLTRQFRPWGPESLRLATEIFDSGAPADYVNAFAVRYGGLADDWERAQPYWVSGIPLEFAVAMLPEAA
ncbi:hypothetical protein [Microbacterium sp. Leaf203]|uniref:hypothetical protein n=1 Tax=Microbacterium sp. Leaf203 TaxID=1735677 RepID=UPI0006FF395F|nr:hypothetical protein [Microbacterium sp. Leaf203]KQM36861.1 hypothetical protein ASE56_10630 [Microbacterium sp. Leaf203]